MKGFIVFRKSFLEVRGFEAWGVWKGQFRKARADLAPNAATTFQKSKSYVQVSAGSHARPYAEIPRNLPLNLTSLAVAV